LCVIIFDHRKNRDDRRSKVGNRQEVISTLGRQMKNTEDRHNHLLEAIKSELSNWMN